jgi:hypothetical protein
LISVIMISLTDTFCLIVSWTYSFFYSVGNLWTCSYLFRSLIIEKPAKEPVIGSFIFSLKIVSKNFCEPPNDPARFFRPPRRRLYAIKVCCWGPFNSSSFELFKSNIVYLFCENVFLSFFT